MIRVSIKGDLACFTRPEFKVERMSYDVITPSAARGVIESIMWHPGMRWVVDQIAVMAPKKFVNIRRNEVSDKAGSNQIKTAINQNRPIFLDAKKAIQQRATTALKNVHYICDYHFELTDKANESDSEAKFYNMALRRLKKGQCFQQPYLGCREFPAEVSLFSGEMPDCPDEFVGEKDLGYMFYDFDYSNSDNIQPQFFRAIANDGIIDLRNAEVKK